MSDSTMQRIEAAVLRVEEKMDQLLNALAADDGEEESKSLHNFEGEVVGRERDQSQPLG